MIDLSKVPVVVGAGQHTNRIDDALTSPDPFEMLETVTRAAASDASPRLPDPTHVWVVSSLSLRHDDPAGELARRLGTTVANARYSGVGGAMPQWLVNRAAELVLSGARPVVVIAGAEALATRRRAKRAGVKLTWPKSDGQPETWPPPEADFGVTPAEIDHGLSAPSHMYALIETAVADAMGHGLEAHLEWMGGLMDDFNAVAADNPYSWFPTRRDATEIATPTPENRWVCFPYPKFLNAIMDVDMAAALIVTDAQTARDAGIASDEVAHVRGWADAQDVRFVSQRPSLSDSPAIEGCGRVALSMADHDVDAITAFDLYSCFPSAVEVSARALGVQPGDGRPLTLTGGLPYHGGPGNNYVTHVLANTFAHVREHPDAAVLVNGNGYYLTKHAVGVYTSRPPDAVPEPSARVQEDVDAAATPLPFNRMAQGAGRVVAYTVPFDRDGDPAAGIVLADVDGTRTVALADDELTAVLHQDLAVGTPISVTAGEPTAAASLRKA